MIEILVNSPLLTLFLVIALGYLIGRIRIGSFSLGVAGALFAGIAVSALNADLELDHIVYQLGLVLFVYTTGIALGPTFFAGLRKTGLRDNAFTLAMIVLGALAIGGVAILLGLGAPLAAGLFAGTFTVTPALAGVMEALDGNSAAPVVGYSLAYPLSVLASLMLIGFFRKFWKIDELEHQNAKSKSLNPHSVLYERDEPVLVGDVSKLSGTYVSVSRIKYKGEVVLAKPSMTIQPGSIVTVVSNSSDLEKVAGWMGGKIVSDDRLELEASEYRHRRVFISNEKVAGKRLGSLHLYRDYHITLTRIRRGDVDMIAHDNMILELGDRARIVGRHEDIDKAAKFLGDSYSHVSHFPVFTFAAGIALGVLVGTITIPLPGGNEFSLGAAGGTIIVALILGALRRTGRLVWQIPYGTNLSLRQFGLMIFLGGVGTTAGGALVKALGDPASYYMLAASFATAVTIVVLMLVIGYKFLRIPFSRLSGMVAAANTQPATLAYATDLAKTDDANAGYASVYPLALVSKIIIAQILLIALSSL